MASVSIRNRIISSENPPFIIAEFSGNHNQDLMTAEKMVKAAAEAGVSAIKLQTYRPDTITLDSDREEFQIREEGSLWRGERLYDLYGKAFTPWEWHAELFHLAQQQELLAFSSPFDETSVEYLENLDVPCYKIASFEINHFPLLKAVANTGKPVIMSTGMATLPEIEEAIEQLYRHGCKELVLLKCTSTYPAKIGDANLLTIPDMKERFGVPVGLSDHTKGTGVAIAAAAMGADVIERHFVLDKDFSSVDAAFSSDPAEFRTLVNETREIRQALGTVHYGPTVAEEASLKYRRSIYVSQELSAGTVLSGEMLKVVRPALGMHPKYFESVKGRTLQVAKPANSPLQESDLL